jgi:hypothetical protein
MTPPVSPDELRELADQVEGAVTGAEPGCTNDELEIFNRATAMLRQFADAIDDAGIEKSGEQRMLEVPETDLHDLYDLLADATQAAATGNPNGCASAAADAKQELGEIYQEAKSG